MASLPFSTASASPAGQIFAVTPAAASFANGPCRAILCETGGATTLRDGADNLKTGVPLQAGYNPIQATAITASDATNIWILY
jgi:hypothetical protein